MADYLAEALVHGRRPSSCSGDMEERKLGQALCRHTCKKKSGYESCYDPVFDKKIRELRPDWFENTADIKKEELLKLAKSGGKRPNQSAKDEEERKFGVALVGYTNKSHDIYDSVFDKKIRKLRPDWFENTADLNKKKLLKLAKSGGKRPNQKAKDEEERKFGAALGHYTNGPQTGYDLVFDKKIRKLRPDWFENKSIKKKEKLLELARSGGDRPRGNAKDEEERKLGRSLVSYTCESHSAYDPVFTRKVRQLRPRRERKQQKRRRNCLSWPDPVQKDQAAQLRTQKKEN